MRSLLPLLVPAITVIFGCGTTTTEGSERTTLRPDSASTSASPKSVVPAKFEQMWQLPTLDRWDAYWLEQYAADSSGDLRQRAADLDGDGGIDHALFLCRIDTTRRDSSYALLITFSNGRDTLLASYPGAESEGGIGMGLQLERPGELGHLGGEEAEEEEPA